MQGAAALMSAVRGVFGGVAPPISINHGGRAEVSSLTLSLTSIAPQLTLFSTVRSAVLGFARAP
jgi:hypothetical protein